MTPKFSFKTNFKFGWKGFTGNLAPLGIFYLLALGINVLLVGLMGWVSQSPAVREGAAMPFLILILLYILFLLFNVLVWLAGYQISLRISQKVKLSLSDIFPEMSTYFSFLGGSLVFSFLLILAVSTLLVIPFLLRYILPTLRVEFFRLLYGIFFFLTFAAVFFFLTKFYFFGYFIEERKTPVLQSFFHSFELTRGYSWKLLLHFLILYVPMILIIILSHYFIRSTEILFVIYTLTGFILFAMNIAIFGRVFRTLESVQKPPAGISISAIE
jgi:hypothetical protein